MFDADDDLALQEVASADNGCGGDRLVEGAVEVAAVVGAAFAGGSFAFDAIAAYREHGRVSSEEATRLEMAELRTELHEMQRQQAYDRGGLAGLDAFDEWHYEDAFEDFGSY